MNLIEFTRFFVFRHFAAAFAVFIEFQFVFGIQLVFFGNVIV